MEFSRNNISFSDRDGKMLGVEFRNPGDNKVEAVITVPSHFLDGKGTSYGFMHFPKGSSLGLDNDTQHDCDLVGGTSCQGEAIQVHGVLHKRRETVYEKLGATLNQQIIFRAGGQN